METKAESKKHSLKRLYILLGLLLLGVIAALLFHQFIKPLDVTYYILMRRLGIQ